MKVFHRVTVTVDDVIQNKLRDIGIEVDQGFVTFEVDETNASWCKLEPMLSEWQAVDIATTKFTAGELRKAASLRMASSWQHGYPQPDDDFGYLTTSYNLADYCGECGVGKRQVAPLRMKSEPKWGNKHFLQLNWVFDEFFVLPRVWESTFEPFGIGCMPVVDHRTGKELQTVVQLDIEKTAASALQFHEGQPFELCLRCERKKYLPNSKGPFPLLEQSSTCHVQRTQEYFGTGAAAWKAIIVSADVFQRITEQNLKGVEFIPCVETVRRSPWGQ